MTRFDKLAIGAVLAGTLAWGGAQATENTAGTAARGGEMMAEAGSAAAPAATGAMLGEHTMPGTVTSVDKDGKVGVKTGVGELHLHFPPAALEGVKEGDNITIKMAFQKS